jgi:exopolysaccharide biosynthesis polyprenyl glycosylphosphotransferase
MTAAPHLASAPTPAPVDRGTPHRSPLRATLVALDTGLAAAAWVVVLVLAGTPRAWIWTVVATAVTLACVRARLLYRARICAVRSTELTRLGSAVAIATALVYGGSHVVGSAVAGRTLVLGGALTFVLLGLGRGWFAQWLRHRRQAGDHCRPVVLVGEGEEARTLAALVQVHPELGIRIVGSVGSGPVRDVTWMGDLGVVSEAREVTGADGVLVATADLDVTELNRTVRELTRAGAHVQFSSGLHGIDPRRIRSVPLAHEPLYYLEPATLSRGQLLVKRAVDLVGASLLLLLASPVLAIAAIAIKLGDGGPVLFRQVRVGHHGREFTLLKLRTMVPDAEARLVDVSLHNERIGPLFKVTHDPRRTRVGRVLERTSLDEIPQLLNVVRGEMSLVGPRPALPHEVAQFEADLLGRHDVVPGITGLWQVEGRENPSFEVYRRLDLHYVENWSLALDLVILVGTMRAVLARMLPFGRRGSADEPAAALSPDPRPEVRPAG